MTINDKIRNYKLQYNINREAAKISALSSCKIDKYEYHIRDLFTFKKSFRKKTIVDQVRKQIDTIINQNERK